MARGWLYDTEAVRAARDRIKQELEAKFAKLGVHEPVTLHQIVGYAVSEFDTRQPRDYEEAYQTYVAYRNNPPYELRVTLTDETEATIQRIGARLSQELDGVRSPNGYNRKLIILLAMLTIGAEGKGN